MFGTALQALETTMAARVFEKIFVALVPRTPIDVYTTDRSYIEMVQKAQRLSLARSPEHADIALVGKTVDFQSVKPLMIFSTEPEVYQSHPACVGVFFWKHGRIEILFSQQRLARFGVRLSSEWDPYLEP